MNKTQKLLVVYTILAALCVVAYFFVEPAFWLLLRKDQTWCSWDEFHDEIQRTVAIAKPESRERTKARILLEKYCIQEQKIRRDLTRPETKVFMQKFSDLMYPSYKNDRRWTSVTLHTHFVTITKRRLQYRKYTETIDKTLIGWTILCIVMAIIIVIEHTYALVKFCKRHKVPTGIRLCWNASLVKDPKRFVLDYARFYRRERNARFLERQKKEVKTEVDNLMDEVKTNLDAILDLDFVEEIERLLGILIEVFPESPRDMRLREKHVRNLVQRTYKKLNTPVRTSSPPKPSPTPGPQKLNPRKRKNQPRQKPVETITPQPVITETAAVPEWHIFFVTKPDGVPIPLELTLKSFHDVLITHRPGVPADQLLARIRRLLFEETPKDRRTYVPMKRRFRGYRKAHAGLKTRFFFITDEKTHTLTFNAYLRSELDRLGADYQ